MWPTHYRFWPRGLPYTLYRPKTTLDANLEISARRYPHKPAIVFYDSTLTYKSLDRAVDAMTGYLQHRCGLTPGDRVLLYSQNCPQFVISYYAILRAGAAVVPANPMYVERELDHIVRDSEARIALVAGELLDRVRPLQRAGALAHVVQHRYADYLTETTDLELPADLRSPPARTNDGDVVDWQDALAADERPAPVVTGHDTFAVLGYTSGTTGQPKGCVHTHGTIMAAVAASQLWRGARPTDVNLAVAPLFHFLGMQGGMNVPLFAGSTIMLMQRWNRDTAMTLIQRYRVTSWSAAPPMITEFFANPAVAEADLGSLYRLMGGGAAMPEAVAGRLQKEYGIYYNEGYGLTESAAFILGNPPARGKRQCLGIPTFDVDARAIDPVTLEPVPDGEPGELILHGPQIMKEYWRAPEANAETFIERDGKRFLRTGDLVRIDDEGYFFMVDRIKRMINASGFKIWPAEVESIMYAHPAVQEACVVGAPDSRRGETALAVVVLRSDCVGNTDPEQMRAWCREEMAAYKVPTRIEFVDALPRSGTGKIQWREIQARIAKRNA